MECIRGLTPSKPRLSPERLSHEIGRRIFNMEYCVACHDEKGHAQSTLGQTLPRRDFTKACLTDKQMTQIIAHGSQSAALAPWDGILNSGDVRQVILFICRTIQH